MSDPIWQPDSSPSPNGPLTFGDIRVIRAYPKPHEWYFEIAKQVPAWLELGESAPALSVMVAYCWEFDGGTKEGALERIQQYVYWKRRRLCAVFGLPANEAAVHFLSRVEVSLCGPAHLLALREIIVHEPECLPLLRRLDILSIEAIRKISLCDCCDVRDDDPTAVRNFLRLPKTVRVILQHSYQLAIASWQAVYLETREAWPTIREVPSLFWEMVKPFDKGSTADTFLAANMAAARRTTAAWLEHSPYAHYDLPWPAPPIPGTDSIVPVLSYDELVREGQEMHHCVVERAVAVRSGHAYIYRVLSPSRATLCLKRSDGEWWLGQLRGPRNKTVDTQVSAQIKHWLRRHRTGD